MMMLDWNVFQLDTHGHRHILGQFQCITLHKQSNYVRESTVKSQLYDIKLQHNGLVATTQQKIIDKYKPEDSYSAHHDGWRFLVKAHGDVLNVCWIYPVSCTCCDPNSPLTTGVLVLCNKLYTPSSTLRYWGCVLQITNKRSTELTSKIFF